MDSAEREELVQRVVARSKADATEALLYEEDFGLTRFTHGAIHQNVRLQNVTLRIRAIVDGRTGVAETNHLADVGIDASLERACEIARLAPPDPELPPLSSTQRTTSSDGAYVEATARASAEDRARVVGAIFDAGEAHGLWSAGYVTTSSGGITLANSSGTVQSHDGTDSGLNVKQNGPSSTGFAERYSNDVRDIDGTRSGEIAARKALASADPITLEPGEYTVIMEPPAFGEIMGYIADHFSAQAYDEGSSFFSGRLGERFVGDNVTVFDDVAHPLNVGMPFDFEGVPTERVRLFDRGTASGLVTDSRWAAKLGRPNTGHALPEPNSAGPQPRHLVVQPGTETHDELIAQTERGLLVSRLWYVRTVDQRQTIVTGMTRDGTFLIENGKLTKGVRNLRFNQSITEALQRCTFSRELARTASYSYAMVVPSVRFERFTFSSATDF
ncbi:MAG: TldD/PmbA family protein [Candidatus Eremiobacteraeota bacterium]|nr:TldD/PmbA family protein [Candidatus Eremiobacteraeota bacterium]